MEFMGLRSCLRSSPFGPPWGELEPCLREGGRVRHQMVASCYCKVKFWKGILTFKPKLWNWKLVVPFLWFFQLAQIRCRNNVNGTVQVYTLYRYYRNQHARLAVDYSSNQVCNLQYSGSSSTSFVHQLYISGNTRATSCDFRCWSSLLKCTPTSGSMVQVWFFESFSMHSHNMDLNCFRDLTWLFVTLRCYNPFCFCLWQAAGTCFLSAWTPDTSSEPCQGGIRLYLDLHAHSNRRGGFLLGDSGTSSEARLFGWALGRRATTKQHGL